jgi:uncharacterized protein (DUF1501 family)
MPASTDRRTFLKKMGGMVVATAAGPIVLDTFLPGGANMAWAKGGTPPADSLPVGTPICVMVSLDGGNDALNTVVPVNNGWYYDAAAGHGQVALPAAQTLALNGTTDFRLHPNLPWLANRWNTVGDVAVVHGVGERSVHSFSHFDSMSFWQTADTTLLERRGWMGRFNDTIRPGNPLASVSLSELRPESVGTSSPTLVLSDTSEFQYELPWLDSARFRSGLDRMATNPSAGFLGQASKLISTTFGVSTRVNGATDPAITGGGPYSDITERLLQAALLIRAGIPCQTYTAAFGTFDSHDNQQELQATRFTELDQALTKFFAALNGHARQRDVFVMIVSEFGRQATANETGGTDHGQAGMAVIVGNGARGGFYGQFPTLDPGGPTRPNRLYDALVPTVDFRSIHATAINRLAGNTNVGDAVLRAHYEDLGIFSPVAPPPPPGNRPPVAGFTTTPNPATGRAPLTVKVDATSSTDPDGRIVKWAWNFGDGTPVGTKNVATHRYAARGVFVITLTVTDDRGATATKTATVTVT